MIQQLVEALDSAQIDYPLADGKTALMLACKIGHPMTAKVLLGAKADPMLREDRSKEADGFSSIMHAALFGHTQCVATVLHNAGQTLDRATRQALHQGLINAHNGNNFTALHLAALHGQRRVVQLLLRERAEVDSPNEKGETPLHVSSKNGHAQVVCALLASGAAVDKTDKMERTALHHCCVTSGGKDVADALMEVGASVDPLDKDQNTPLHLACKTGNHLTVDTLLKFKVGESAPSPAFQSTFRPISHPASPGSSSRMPQADITLRNKDGQVAFMVATKEGHDTIKEKLQPVRQNLIAQMPEINMAKQFREARLAVKDYGLQRLKHEMGVPPHRATRTSPLVGTQA